MHLCQKFLSLGELQVLGASCQEPEAEINLYFFYYSMSNACVLSHVQLFATQWAVADQVRLPMGFSR